MGTQFFRICWNNFEEIIQSPSIIVSFSLTAMKKHRKKQKSLAFERYFSQEFAIQELENKNAQEGNA